MVTILRLTLAAVFAVAGTLLIFRDRLLPAEWVNAYEPTRMNLGAAFAFALSAWNLVRLYAGLRRRTPRQPLAEHRDDPDARHFEYHPELDVFRQTNEPDKTDPPADRPAG